MTGRAGSGRATAREIAVPDAFSFRATVYSHGWCALAPWIWDTGAWTLARPFRVPGRGASTVELSQPGGRGAPVAARIVGGAGSRAGLDESGWAAVEAAISRSLRLGDSLETFHDLCREAGPPFDEAPALGFGRLLRSPTAFEDLVKVLATTNTTWGGTMAMVANLVGLAGPQGAFPTPAEVAALGADRLRDEGRWGYRADYLDALARAVADGETDPDAWGAGGEPTEAIAGRVGDLAGFGPYATAHVLALLGRYDRIGVDTVFRAHVRERHFPRARKPPTDRRMLAVYEEWGEWKALAYWFEMWREAIEEGWGLEAG